MFDPIRFFGELATRSLEGQAPTHDEALAVLESGDDVLLGLLQASFRVRAQTFARGVALHVLRNAKSGLCPEDCGFCSQSVTAASGTERYKLQTVEELVAGAREAAALGAYRYCMVTSTRGPSARELAVVCEAVRRIKAELPLDICTSLGLLDEPAARALAEAGVDRFNHNLETSRRFFPSVVGSHAYDERVATLRHAVRAGMEACAGGIIGMGETLADRVDLLAELRMLGVASVPINFLDPRPGTPLADTPRLSPGDCLRMLALARFFHPRADVRVSGGREVNLRHLQPLALYPANSLFTMGYLTTPGQGYAADRQMIADAGFEVVSVQPA